MKKNTAHQSKSVQAYTLDYIPADWRKKFEAGEKPTDGRGAQLYKLWKAAGGEVKGTKQGGP